MRVADGLLHEKLYWASVPLDELDIEIMGVTRLVYCILSLLDVISNPLKQVIVH